MDTLRILTGYGSIDLLNSVPDDVDMRDVCLNLSRIRRWNGAIDFTVAQHSLFVEAILQHQGHNRATCLAGLLHDAHEYATGDIPEPVLDRLLINSKQRLGCMTTGDLSIPYGTRKLSNFQADLQDAIYSKISIENIGVNGDAVHAADMEARSFEVWQLLPDSDMRRELMRTRYQVKPVESTLDAAHKIMGANLDTFTGLLAFYGVVVQI